jgi:transposase InsO family protein
MIDKGTSILVAHHVRSDFTAETALQALAQTFASHGLPASITLDRDTRWVGAPQGSDFPAALVRFCQSLGVAVLICDPHHPQQNGFVERYHRTLNQECLLPSRPKTLDARPPGDRSFCHPLQLAATAESGSSVAIDLLG